MKYAGKNKSCNMRYVGKKLFLSIHFKNVFLEVYKMSPNIKTFEWTAAEAVQPHWSYPAYVEMPAPKAHQMGKNGGWNVTILPNLLATTCMMLYAATPHWPSKVLTFNTLMERL